MGLADLAAARRKELESLKKKPEPFEKVFSEYERGVLAQFNSGEKGQVYENDLLPRPTPPNSDKSQVYRDWFTPPPKKQTQRGEPRDYVKEGASGRELHEQQAMQKQSMQQGPGKYMGSRVETLVTQDYADQLIEEHDRWKKTGSRYVAPVTEQSRRKEHMGKLYGGATQGMSGAMGTARVTKKKLLGA